MSFEKENCPYCNSECEADWVDVEVGYIQCGPYHCDNCGASEIGPYDNLGFDRNLFHEHMKKYYHFEKLENGKFKTWMEKPFIVPKDATITQEEWDKGWFKPHSPMGTSVNTCNGKYVDHKTAKELYDLGLLDEKEEAIENTGK